MSDIFREVDEDVRDERFAKLWQKFQVPVIVLAVLIVAASGGWRYYETARVRQAEEAGARFEAAVQLVRDGKAAEADAAFASIIQQGPAGYALLSRFRQANAMAARDALGAVKLYDAISGDGTVPVLMQDIARLRAAALRLDDADTNELNQRLGSLAQTAGPFRHSAREYLALAALKSNDLEAAGRWLDAIIVDTQSPLAMRQRAELLLGLVAAGKPSSQQENSSVAK